MKVEKRMKLTRTAFLSLVLIATPSAFAFQAQSKDTINPKGQNVPHQEPGTDNPDMGKERRPKPDSPGTTPHPKGEDVPHQEPGTDNPDMGKQRRPTPDSSGTNSTDTSKKKNKSKGQSSSTSKN
jgi:hypothetical protein